MKQSDKKAKVITMVVAMGKSIFTLVTTVDPHVSPSMAQFIFGIPGVILKSEESETFPLPYALDYARSQRALLGIKNRVLFR